MTCIFCAIVKGTDRRRQVWENRDFVAFLDRRPLKPGHLLIVPRRHASYLFQLPPSLYRGLFRAAYLVEPTLKRLTKAKRIGLVVEGFGVDHVHLHMVPLKTGTDIGRRHPKTAPRVMLHRLARTLSAALEDDQV